MNRRTSDDGGKKWPAGLIGNILTALVLIGGAYTFFSTMEGKMQTVASENTVTRTLFEANREEQRRELQHLRREQELRLQLIESTMSAMKNEQHLVNQQILGGLNEIRNGDGQATTRPRR